MLSHLFVKNKSNMIGKMSMVIGMTEDNKNKWIRFVQIASTLIVILITILYWDELKNLTAEKLVASSPAQIGLSIGVILLYYILKSFLVIVPVLVVQIAAGLLFPLPLAIVVNLIGLMLTLSISFVMGRFTGRPTVEKIIARYPKSAIIQTIPQKNEFFFCFIIHSLCIFPMNMIGMFVGALSISYKNYFWGAFLGSMVRVISVTVMGSSVTKPTSPTFIISLAVTLFVSLISFVLYKGKTKKSSAVNKTTDDSINNPKIHQPK